MAISDTSKIGFNYGTTLPAGFTEGEFYITAEGELYLATSTASALHIGALHIAASYDDLPSTADTHALYCTTDTAGLYKWTGTEYVCLNSGQAYTADGTTLTLSGANVFSVTNGGIGTTQLADSAVTNAKLANIPAYSIKMNNTSSAAAPSDITLADVVLYGYAKTSDTGSIAATDTLEKALSRLENNAASGVTTSGALVSGDVVVGAGSKTVTDSGVNINNIVTNTTGNASGANQIILSAAANKTVKDSGISIAATVTDTATTVPTSAAIVDYAQPLDGDLTAIAALAGSSGILTKTAADTWALDTTSYIPITQRGTANGVATLGADSKVPSSQLPSYIDDVIDLVTVCASASTAPTTIEGFYYNTSNSTLYKATDGAWAAYTATSGDRFGCTTDNLIYTYTNSWASSTPVKDIIYIDDATNIAYRYSGTVLVPIVSGNTIWGSISGALADQQDLQTALDAKVAGPASATSGNVAIYNGTTGKVISNSSIVSSNIVTSTTVLTASQLLIGQGNKVAGVLAAGTNGQVLKIVSSVPTWVTEAAYTLPAATSSALGGIKIGYTDTGASIGVLLNASNQAYVTLTSAAIDAAKSNIVTGSSLTSNYLVIGAGSSGVAISAIAVSNVVTAGSTLTNGQLVTGNGSKGLTSSGYAVSTVFSSTPSSTAIPTEAAIASYVNSRALAWGTF